MEGTIAMTHLHIYHRIGIAVLLVALLSGLVPAQPSLAHPARRTLSVNEDQPVHVLPQYVRTEFWVVNAMDRVGGPQRAEMVAFELVLTHLYRQNPDLPPAVAVQSIHDLQTIYQFSGRADQSRYARTANEGVLAVFAALSNQPLPNSPATG